MKKTFGILFALALLSGCGNDEEKKKILDELHTIEHETESIDSSSIIIEQEANEIEMATEQLENALNDL